MYRGGADFVDNPEGSYRVHIIPFKIDRNHITDWSLMSWRRRLLRRVITGIVTAELLVCVTVTVAMFAVFFYFLYYLLFVLPH
jgi:hypothetical protein